MFWSWFRGHIDFIFDVLFLLWDMPLEKPQRMVQEKQVNFLLMFSLKRLYRNSIKPRCVPALDGDGISKPNKLG